MKECVVVLGMHRSGTSVLSGLVSLQGYYLGADEMPTREDNPKGFFENMKIYRLNQSILEACGTSWDDYLFTFDQISPEQFFQYEKLAKDIVKEEFGLVKKIFIKDPRMCLLFPLWEKVLTDLGYQIKVILAYRSPMEVAQSLKMRNQMAYEKSLLMWSHYFLQAEKSSRAYDRILVQYNNDLQDLKSFLFKLTEFLQVEVSDEMFGSASELYSPQLKHHRLTIDNLSNELPKYFKDFLSELKNGKLDDFKKLDEIFEEFYYSQSLYLYNDEKLNKKVESLRRELDVGAKQIKESLREVGRKDNEIKQCNQKIRKAENDYNSLDRQLEKTKKLLGKEQQNKATEIRKRIEQLAIGDELFQTGYLRSEWTNKFSRVFKGSKYFKIKRAVLPFSQASNKRFIDDKIQIIESGLFSTFYYLTRHPQSWKAKVDPLNFYNKHGWKAGHNPGPHFNTREYLSMYEDVAKSGVNPLLHYVQYGKNEGRFPMFPTREQKDQVFKTESGFLPILQGVKYHGPTKGIIESLNDNFVVGWLATEAKNGVPVVKINNYPARNLSISPSDQMNNEGFSYKAEIDASIIDEANIELFFLSEEGALPLNKKIVTTNYYIPDKYADLENAYLISQQKNAVAITVWEGAHNPIGRAKVLYDIVNSKRPVVIFAYIFGQFGNDLWGPLKKAGLNVVLIPYGKRQEYQAYIKERSIEFDTTWICKHRLHSFELASFISHDNTACILDMDDNEDEFISSKGSENKSYGVFSKNKGQYYLGKITSRSVASHSIQEQFGGRIVRHARKKWLPKQVSNPVTDFKTIVFIGTIRPHKNITELVNTICAFNNSRNEKIKLVIGGDFNPPSLRQTLNTADTIILDEIPSNDLYETLAQYDVVITGYPDKKSESQEINRLQITSKIGDGLAIGRPVLTPYSPSVSDLDDVQGLFIFQKDNFNEKLEKALSFEGEVELPKEFTIEHSYEAFRALEKSAQIDSMAKNVFEMEPFYNYQKNSTKNQNNIVLVWKQFDSGIYGRRIDHIARYYKYKHPESKVTVIEVISEGRLNDYDNAMETFDNSSVILNEVLSQKIYRYTLDNVDYHLITDNEVGHLNTFSDKFDALLSSESIYPFNSIFILFPLLQVHDELIHKIKDYKIIVDLVDNQVQWMKKPEVRLKALKQYFEIISIADEVVANSPTNIDYFKNLNFFDNLNPQFIPNWYTLPDGFSYKREVNGSEINLIYSGNLNDRIDWRLFDKICKTLINHNGYLHIVGSTVRRSIEMKRLLQNKNCIYHGVINEKQLLRLLQHIDFAVVPHVEDRISKYMDPIKLKMYKKLGITSLTSKLPGLPDDDPMLHICESAHDFLEALERMIHERNEYMNNKTETEVVDVAGDEYVSLINKLLLK